MSVRPSVGPFVCALTAEPFYQSVVFVCVSVIRGHILIIAHMRSISVLIFLSVGNCLRVNVPENQNLENFKK